MKKILIAGGGISGLTARYYLSKKYPQSEILLLEKSNRLGGCIQTTFHPFFFEKGPRTFKTSRSQEFITLIKELGIEENILFSHKESHRRFIWQDGRLKSPFSFINKWIFPLLKEWKKPYPSEKDESIESFVKRRLGSFIADNIFDPLTLGIYGGDISKLSIRSCFSNLKSFEMEYGSITKGFLKSFKVKKTQGGLFTLKGGMSGLIEKLIEKGKGEIRLNTDIKEVNKEFDHHVLALPSKGLRDFFWFDPELQTFFGNLKSVNLCVVNVVYKTAVLKEKGFGYLIPSSQGEKVLGVIFDSCIFPEQNQTENETRFTVILGGAFHPDLDPKEGRDTALIALKKHLKIDIAPEHSHTTYYPQAIPQYFVGHQERVTNFEVLMKKRYPYITCIGNSMYGPSINQCIQTAKRIIL